MSPNDITNTKYKIEIRKRFIKYIDKKRVLDLYCGFGKMYNNCYKGLEYVGIDSDKIHNADLCYLEDNKEFVNKNNIENYNIIDLDSDDDPWGLFDIVLRKLKEKKVVIFITDNNYQKMKNSYSCSTSLKKTDNIKFEIPLLFRFYKKIVGTHIAKKIRDKYIIKEAKYLLSNNKKKTYISLYMESKQ